MLILYYVFYIHIEGEPNLDLLSHIDATIEIGPGNLARKGESIGWWNSFREGLNK